jgi:hypothetical protein
VDSSLQFPVESEEKVVNYEIGLAAQPSKIPSNPHIYSGRKNQMQKSVVSLMLIGTRARAIAKGLIGEVHPPG